MMGGEAWNFVELWHKIEQILLSFLLNKKPEYLRSNQRIWKLEGNGVNAI